MGKKAITIITVIFALILFSSAFLGPIFMPQMKYWDIVKAAGAITIAIVLYIDYYCEKKTINNGWKIAVQTYKVAILGASAFFSLWASVVFLPLHDKVKLLRGDLVLFIALFTFEEAFKKYLFKDENSNKLITEEPPTRGSLFTSRFVVGWKKMGVRYFTKKWIVILTYVFALLIFGGVCYRTVNSNLDDNVKVSIISAVGIIITATISVCTLLFNAEQQRIAEFRKVKITYYNKFIETLYNAFSNTTNNSDSNSNEGKIDAQAEFIMEFNRLPLYASEEVIRLAAKKQNVNVLINEIRKDLVNDKYAVFKDLNFEFQILNKGDNKEAPE